MSRISASRPPCPGPPMPARPPPMPMSCFRASPRIRADTTMPSPSLAASTIPPCVMAPICGRRRCAPARAASTRRWRWSTPLAPRTTKSARWVRSPKRRFCATPTASIRPSRCFPRLIRRCPIPLRSNT
ncbi:tetratricopeptide repeat protein, partial [Bordetella holmesii H620]